MHHEISHLLWVNLKLYQAVISLTDHRICSISIGHQVQISDFIEDMARVVFRFSFFNELVYVKGGIRFANRPSVLVKNHCDRHLNRLRLLLILFTFLSFVSIRGTTSSLFILFLLLFFSKVKILTICITQSYTYRISN